MTPINSNDALPFENFSKKKVNLWFNFDKNEVLLLISYLFFGVAFANYEPYAPVWLSQIFNEDSFLIIGLVLVIPSIISAIGTFFWGFLADKFGSKKFVIIGLVAYLVMFFCLIFTSSSIYFLIIILGGFLIGSAQTSNFYALATSTIKKPKEVILAKIVITIGISWSVISPIVGYVYDNYSNSMTIQLIIAIIASVISIFFVIFVKEEKITKIITKKEAFSPEKVSLSSVPLIFTGLMVLIFFFQSTGGFWAYTSIYFLETLNVRGIYYSIFLIIKTALTIPLSLLLGKIKRTKIVGIISTIFVSWICLSYLITTIFPSNWILLLIILSVPLFPLNNISFNYLITKITREERRATAFGLASTVGTIGYVLGIVILGVSADLSSLGIEVMLRISLIFGLITLVVMILFFVFGLRKKLTLEESITTGQQSL